MRRYLLTLSIITAGVAGVASAAELYSSGDKTWDTTTANWGTAFGGPYNTATWSSATPDSAFLEGESGTGGTVTLAENIDIANLTFYDNTSADGAQNNVRNFTVQGYALSFSSGGEIRAHLTYHKQRPTGSTVTITSAITGSPDVYVSDNGAPNKVTFAPTGTDIMVLGACYVPYEAGIWDKCELELGGSSDGNTVESMEYLSGQRWGTCRKTGDGSWEVTGQVRPGQMHIEAGHFILNTGYLNSNYDPELKGGVLHYNHSGASRKKINITGGALDNSSGAPIATSDYNPAFSWKNNWGFVGSSGAASDLYMGNGAITLTGDTSIDIQNADTTLSFGGAVTDGAPIYGLTKTGPGALLLSADNDYAGATTVSAGTLHIKHPCLSDDGAVSVESGAVLNLDFTGTDDVFLLNLGGSPAAIGEWGAVGSGAANESALLTGSGRLNNGGGLAPAGTWYWDGTSSDIPTDGDGAAAGGNGTWSTAVANWDHGVTSHKVWNNTTNDLAVFRAAKGTVDLATSITLGEMLIDGVDNYVFGETTETGSLHFGGESLITVDSVHAEFKAGITGNPDIDSFGGFRKIVKMTADGASQALGAVTFGASASSNPEFWLQGTNTTCSAESVSSSFTYSFLKKYGTGTWTVGNISCGWVGLYDGKLVLNGTMTTGWNNFNFYGGTLAGTGVINSQNAPTVPASGTIEPGDATGALAVLNKDCTIDGTLLVNVDASQASPNGTLAVDNTLTLGATSVLDVNVISAPGGTITIATYGTRSGTFNEENLPNGWTIDYGSESHKAITLTGMPTGTVILLR